MIKNANRRLTILTIILAVVILSSIILAQAVPTTRIYGRSSGEEGKKCDKGDLVCVLTLVHGETSGLVSPELMAAEAACLGGSGLMDILNVENIKECVEKKLKEAAMPAEKAQAMANQVITYDYMGSLTTYLSMSGYIDNNGYFLEPAPPERAMDCIIAKSSQYGTLDAAEMNGKLCYDIYKSEKRFFGLLPSTKKYTGGFNCDSCVEIKKDLPKTTDECSGAGTMLIKGISKDCCRGLETCRTLVGDNSYEVCKVKCCTGLGERIENEYKCCYMLEPCEGICVKMGTCSS